MQNLRLLLVGLALACLSVSCEHKSDEKPDENPEEKQDFSCIQLFDANGLPFGIHGSCSTTGQWGALALTEEEKTYLNFPDTVSLAGTQNAAIDMLAIYPNPVMRGGAVQFSLRSATGGVPVKIKLTVVNEAQEVLRTYAFQTTTNGSFALMVDETLFTNGEYYRLYYRVSSATNASLFEGYGNFLVCKTYIAPGLNTISSDCI